jgi:hypothetical protein
MGHALSSREAPPFFPSKHHEDKRAAKQKRVHFIKKMKKRSLGAVCLLRLIVMYAFPDHIRTGWVFAEV